MRGWRGLLAFWIILLLALGTGAGVLQYLARPVRALPQAASLPAAKTAAAVVAPTAAIALNAPDPALAEALADDPALFVPIIAADGRRSMNYYAAAQNFRRRGNIVGLLIAGMGLSQTTSEHVISQLPAAVSFAFSPYAADPAPLLAQSRAAGHEYLISVPLEPANSPLDSEGAHQLLVASADNANTTNLEWVLSRFAGYVGGTSALDGMRGETYLRSQDHYDNLQRQLNQRGLLFIDARPGSAAPAGVPGRGIDVVIDDPPDAASIDAKLAALVSQARAQGSALGLAGPLRPVALAHLIAWIARLPSQGVTLVPVSAVVAPSEPPGTKQ